MPALWAALDTVSLPATAIALFSLVTIVILRRLAPRFPGLIVAMAAASLIVVVFSVPVDTIQSRFGDLPSTLPAPSLPEFSLERISELFPSAMVIAFLAGIESLLSAMVADRMIQGAHRPNAELTAQGAANILSSLFGGMPATGAIARTAMNVQAGGKTPIAGTVHALVILVVMYVAAPLAGRLAMPALAALLMLTAWNMSEPHKWAGYARARASDRVLLLITMALTVLIDLAVAIGVGVSVGLALRLYRRRQEIKSDWTVPDR